MDYYMFTMKNKIAILIFFIIALFVAGIFIYTENKELFNGKEEVGSEKLEEDASRTVRPEEPASEEFTFPLTDVTEGLYVDSITTEGEALGMLEVSISSERTMLRAVFENLPLLDEDYFYEGWLVDTDGTNSFISTGEALLDSRGNHVNDFVSTEDLSAYDQYVLTLEPNDGDPAPDGHLLEGDIVWGRSVNQAEGAAEGISEDEESEVMEETAGFYGDYEPSLLANAENGIVILFFKTDECSTCKAFEEDLQENIAQLPTNMTLLKINLDVSDVLKTEYGVVQEHTYIQVDAQGNELKRWVGSSTLEQFLADLL